MSDKYVSHDGLAYFWSKIKALLAGKQDSIITNESVAAQTGFSSNTYLTGSKIILPGAPVVGTTYKLTFDVTKTAAGTAAPIIYIRVGTAGTISDAAVATLTFGAGNNEVDSGVFEVICTFRTVGSSAVMQCISSLVSNVSHLTQTGLSNGKRAIIATSSSFNSTTAGLCIGASYNGGTLASHTIQLVRAELLM